MWESTSSFARVAVLVLVTGGFGAAWNGDQQSQTAFALARRSEWRQRSESQLAHSTASVAPEANAACPPPSTPLRQVLVEMELPPGIAPGRYQVIEPSGRMMNVIVPDGLSGKSNAPRDLYVQETVEGVRVRFMRLGPEPSSSPIRSAGLQPQQPTTTR